MKAQIVISSVLAVTASQFVGQAQETGKGRAGDGFPARVRKVDEIKFKHSSFTFVRIKYSGVSVHRPTWAIDYPDADLNFAAQFQKETGLKVDTNGMVLELTDPRLKQQPFIYIA